MYIFEHLRNRQIKKKKKKKKDPEKTVDNTSDKVGNTN